MKNIRTKIHALGTDTYAAGARLIVSLALLATLFAFPSCNDSELWDELPAKVSEFINQYYPNCDLQSVSAGPNGCHVRIDDGPSMSFDKNEQWTAIDGYGMPLLQVLLFDQLPPAVYEYLQGSDQLNSVFSMSRDKVSYTIVLLNSNLYYDIATGELTGPIR